MSAEETGPWFPYNGSGGMAGPGMFDAGHGVSYTTYYADEAKTDLIGLLMWHPCPVTRERMQMEDDDMTGMGPNARTGRAWGYSGEPATITLEGSVQCRDCGWHGFVRGGRWEPC